MTALGARTAHTARPAAVLLVCGRAQLASSSAKEVNSE